MRDIAKMVGISAAALYYHLPDKDALYLITISQHHRWSVILVTLLMVMSTGLFMKSLGTGFMPDEDERRFIVTSKPPLGSNLECTRDRLAAIESVLRTFPEVRCMFSTIATGDTGRVNQGQIFISLTPRSERKEHQQQLLNRVRQRLSSVPGVQAFASPVPIVGGQRGEPLQFIIKGPNLKEVARLAAGFEERLSKIPQIGSLDMDLQLELSELRLVPDRDKASVMEIINNITMLSLVLTGAALIREREHGTVEHLLVMPVTPFEIMSSKVLAMILVVLAASAFSLMVIVRGFLAVPIEGSLVLFFAGAALSLFATTSMGIFLATVSRSMPQFALMMMVILPLQNLSGAMTPRESMPEMVQTIMLAAPTTHFVMLAQSILYRGAGTEVVWPQFLSLIVIGTVLFMLSLARFRKTLATMA